jgi:hypothetical protein
VKRTAKQWEADYNHAKALALKCATERDALQRSIDDAHKQHVARIEALHADLRVRTAERDAARNGLSAEARKYAETRRLADDLQAELAAVKVALAESKKSAQEWENDAHRQMVEMGKAIGHAEILAAMVKRGLPASKDVADYVLSLGLKPCAT